MFKGSAFWLKIIGFVSLSYLLTACGTSGSSEETAGSQTGTGTVGILLTDAPADPDQFLEINVSIESIELFGSNEQGNQTLYSGPTKTINLFDLKNESMPFTFQEGIVAGEYCKIRLRLSSLELVLVDDTPEDRSDNETFYPRLPGNNKLDLNIRDCVTVSSGETLAIQLDMDAERSIHISGNGLGNNKYQFRPVVFVDALAEEFDPKLLRLEGELVEYDESLNTLLLCDALPTIGLNNNGCVEIHLNNESAFFDNVEYSGAPRATAELFDDSKLDTVLTAVGWPRYLAPEYFDIEVPYGHLPPIGSCRLWNVGLEPGQQSAPIDCDELPEIIPDNVAVVDHNGLVRDPNRPVIILDALVIEEGEFLVAEGAALENADSSGVSISPTLGSSILVDSLDISFQEGELGVNGTRLVSKKGQLLSYESIVADTLVQVDGVLDVSIETDANLRAALVIIDSEGLSQDTLTGTVTSVEDNAVLINVDSDTVCGVSLTVFELDLHKEFDALSVTITEDASEVSSTVNFEEGFGVGINGFCNGAIFEPQSVVLIHDLRQAS